MTLTLPSGARSGTVPAPASKSAAHRLLICAALGRSETELVCPGRSEDVEATVRCLRALGAEIREEAGSFFVRPIEALPMELCQLPCGESGSTLRFLLPLVGALGVRAVFLREGRLPVRPLQPLTALLENMGMTLTEEGSALRCEGRLRPGDYAVSGAISSQFVSGLLMALPLLGGESTLRVTDELVSAPYVALTERVLSDCGVRWEKDGALYRIPGAQRCILPDRLRVEGDWSGAASFLCMGAFSERGVCVTGLSPESAQGDRAVLALLRRFGAQVSEDRDGVTVRRGALHGIELDATAVPDLVPALSVLAAVSEGETRFLRAGRLRFKESDRLEATVRLLRSLGATVSEESDGLALRGVPTLQGGEVPLCRDHRIAMAAAIAACACTDCVTVPGAECVGKSYGSFWEAFGSLSLDEGTGGGDTWRSM